MKYSHSSVDVLSCFASVIDEWRRIDVHDPDCALLGVTKVTDVSYITNEPSHEVMALFVLRKLIIQTRMRSSPVGLDVRFLI